MRQYLLALALLPGCFSKRDVVLAGPTHEVRATDSSNTIPAPPSIVRLKSVAALHQRLFALRRATERSKESDTHRTELLNIQQELIECADTRTRDARVYLHSGRFVLAATIATEAATINPLDRDAEEMARTASFFVFLQSKSLDDLEAAYLRDDPYDRAIAISIEHPLFESRGSRNKVNPDASLLYFLLPCAQAMRKVEN